MGGLTRWFGWRTVLMLLPVVAALAAQASGLVVAGLVTTGSMEPGLPPGSLVLALPGQAEIDDVVVFRAPDGGQVVHRVVDVTPEGLWTQGDANQRPDQADGMPPVPQGKAHPVPTVAGVPATVAGTWLQPLGLIATQVALFTVGLKGLLDDRQRDELPWPMRRIGPTSLLVAAGALLLVAAPALSETVEAGGALQVQGLPVPTLVQITDAGDPSSTEGTGTTTYRVLAPLSKSPIETAGQAEIVRAPALPGAKSLAPHGAVWAMLPTALAVWAGALAVRIGGAR